MCIRTHTYTGYPMIRQMRDLISKGLLGTIQRIDAQYYQGWINSIIYGTGSRITGVWRLDPKHAGASSCMGDIGVHAFNLIEYTTVCLLYTSPSPRDRTRSRMPSS